MSSVPLIAQICRVFPRSVEASALAVLGEQHGMSYFFKHDIVGLPSSEAWASEFCARHITYGAFSSDGHCLGVAGVSSIEERPDPRLGRGPVSGVNEGAARARRLVPWYAVAPQAQGRGVAATMVATITHDALHGPLSARAGVAVGVHAWCAQGNLGGQAVARSIGLGLDTRQTRVARLAPCAPERVYVRLAAEPQQLDLRRRIALSTRRADGGADVASPAARHFGLPAPVRG